MTDLVEKLSQARIVGVLRADSADSAVEAALSAVRGGLRAIELTFTTPDVEQALAALKSRLPGEILLGAGTVMNAAQANVALEAGAVFLVSPHLGHDVLRVARTRRVPYIPGVITPTEIVRALGLGVGAVKLFPIGSSGGLAYLKDLLGPLPGLRAMVTGGVSPAEVPAYVQAGALAVGLGSNLFPRAALQKADWRMVEDATRAALKEAGR